MINDPNGQRRLRRSGILEFQCQPLAERRLKIMVYLARLFERRINRYAPAMITIDEIRLLKY
jgi:hypothetical protein